MPEIIHLKIDGLEVAVPRGTNLIEAAASVGIEIPFYCYHRHLSVAGNCRMCQVEIEGTPKLSIACNTIVMQGMVVRTHRTSPKVAEAQRATLEFLLINHPLDCTVCDEAGHCKLQDYYYQYHAKDSRFTEEKLHKVKAQPFGPEVIFDGERCILCTRCVRFCHEVTKTNELGVFERGGKSVIGLAPAKELNNVLSGTVCDLCPVGALTHRRWRFNSRFWYASETKSICPGCSTGCSVKVAVRDNKIVLVRARLNSEVNKEWLCDEGRYGFERFQPQERLLSAYVRSNGQLEKCSTAEAYAAVKKLRLKGTQEDAAVFLSPFLTLEEIWLGVRFAENLMGISRSSSLLAVQLKARELNTQQQILISPDYAPNARAAELLGLISGGEKWREELEKRYLGLLDRIRQKQIKRLLVVGDFAVLSEDIDSPLRQGLENMESSIVLTPRAFSVSETKEKSDVAQFAHLLLPSLTVNEKRGTMVNCSLRLQPLNDLMQPPPGCRSEWLHLADLAAALGKPLFDKIPENERELFKIISRQEQKLSGETVS